MESDSLGVSDEPSPSQPPGRPRGVTLLSILAFVGGVALVALLLILPTTEPEKFAEQLEAMATPRWLFYAGVGFLAMLSLASGVGMWIGATWGWWVATFYFVYAVVRAATVLISISEIAEAAPPEEFDIQNAYLKYGVRTLVNTALVAYFFRDRVMGYFGLRGFPKWKALCAVVAAVAILYVAIVLAS